MSFEADLRRLSSQDSPFVVATGLQGEGKALFDNAADLVSGVLPIPTDQVRDDVVRLLATERSSTISYEDHEIFFEVVTTPPLLMIIGAGHAAQALSSMAVIAGFRVIVADPRTSLADPARFGGEVHVRAGWPRDTLADLDLNDRTYVVVLAHDPRLEDTILARAIRSDARYIGALGSRKTHAARMDRLRAGGATDRQVARIHAPIGLEIGAVTAEEMAIAIAGELVQARRRPTS